MQAVGNIMVMILVLLLGAGLGHAEEKQGQGQSNEGDQQSSKNATEFHNISTTKHVLETDGQQFSYTAKAGELVVAMEEDGKKGRFFFVAYHRDGIDQQKRPITFVFNGGPGAAAVWLHLGGLGPRILVLDDHGTPLPPPAELAPNPLTWLRFTDLVFIDPVGTGYSRSESKGENQFWGVKQDVKSVAEFIRLYLGMEQRWLSPKFVVGESYGTTRAASLAGYLDQSFGIRLNGVVLISPVLDFATLALDGSLNLPYALFLPSYAAARMYHEGGEQQWDEVLQPLEAFALKEYLAGLHQGNRLAGEERENLVARVSSITGLSPELIEKNNLRVSLLLFAKNLFTEEKRILGRMDSTVTGVDPAPSEPYAYFDPSLVPLFGPFSSAINQYVRDELDYEKSLHYEFLNNKVTQNWDWSSGLQGGRQGQGYLNAADDLKSAMVRNPYLKVLVASGYFDLATPYFAIRHTLSQMDVSDVIRNNLVVRHFKAGHMIYLKKHPRKNLFDQVLTFYQWSIPVQGKGD